jgi:hypothetical protein
MKDLYNECDILQAERYNTEVQWRNSICVCVLEDHDRKANGRMKKEVFYSSRNIKANISTQSLCLRFHMQKTEERLANFTISSRFKLY